MPEGRRKGQLVQTRKQEERKVQTNLKVQVQIPDQGWDHGERWRQSGLPDVHGGVGTALSSVESAFTKTLCLYYLNTPR